MITLYILIVLYNGVAFQEFTSIAQCEYAKKLIIERYYLENDKVFCIKK